MSKCCRTFTEQRFQRWPGEDACHTFQRRLVPATGKTGKEQFVQLADDRARFGDALGNGVQVVQHRFHLSEPGERRQRLVMGREFQQSEMAEKAAEDRTGRIVDLLTRVAQEMRDMLVLRGVA
jgi:hypothetical protein